jgi:hypothetical protein
MPAHRIREVLQGTLVAVPPIMRRLLAVLLCIGSMSACDRERESSPKGVKVTQGGVEVGDQVKVDAESVEVGNDVKVDTNGVKVGGIEVKGNLPVNVKAGGGIACPDGGCSHTCRDGEACNANCSGGRCTFRCGKNGNCDFNCSGGSCNLYCAEGAQCSLGCTGGSCKQDCNSGAKRCDRSCSGGGCS